MAEFHYKGNKFTHNSVSKTLYLLEKDGYITSRTFKIGNKTYREFIRVR